MAFFRNLTLFVLPAANMPSVDSLQQGMAENRIREPGPLELATCGFTTPFSNSDDERLQLEVSPYVLMRTKSHARLLPSAIVNQELANRMKAIAEKEARRIRAKERKRLKEEVISELMPRAFIGSHAMSAYLDREQGWFVVDTASRKQAENAVSQVREAVGRFPVVPVAPEESPRATMTAWLTGGNLPDGFALGNDVELRDPAEAGAVWRGRHQDLESEEVKEHLKAGKQVFQLGLEFRERISFVLGEDLCIRKVAFTDVVLDTLGEDSLENADAELMAQFTLMTLEFRALLTALSKIFGVTRPAERE